MTIFTLESGRQVDVQTPQEAKTLLTWIESGDVSFPPTQEGAQRYRKLLDLSIADMGKKFHAGDAKRTERAHGHNRSKLRNGS